MQGWIKLYRCLLEKPIWLESTPEQKVILITLLAMANHKGREWEWQGERYQAEPGQFVTSLKSITEKSGKGISIKNVRTALKRFEKYEFLASKSTNKNRLITIVNWATYQESGEEVASNTASNGQATGKQRATNKNVENEKNEINKDIVDVIDYLNFKTGKQFKASTKTHQKHIMARVKEGFTVEDMKKVVDIKAKDWLSDGKMSEYLRPETLFGTKFESYLNIKKNKRKAVEF